MLGVDVNGFLRALPSCWLYLIRCEPPRRRYLCVAQRFSSKTAQRG
jgi:hypothetical protein